MITVKNVSKSYATARGDTDTVLTDINLTFEAGEFVCLLGPSGCGKTTLINLIAGFISPSKGELFINQKAITGPGPERGVVFQDPTLFPWLTAHQNVAFGLRQRRREDQYCAAKTSELLELVGMKRHANAYPHTLSGGMRQRIAIARVLALNPKVLLMDEPFCNLDINSREYLQDKLLEVWGSFKPTTIYVTHSVEEAVYLSDRVIIMGPAPRCIVDNHPIRLKRPRNRLSNNFNNVMTTLRISLDTLPCCLAPLEKRVKRNSHEIQNR